MKTQVHKYHLVDPSPWPFLAAFGALFLTYGGAMLMHSFISGNKLCLIGFILILTIMYCWWNDIIREGTYEGQHTKAVQTGLRFGVLFFIVSEIMFFFGFFWAFFHSAFNPTCFIGGIWVPHLIVALNPWSVPLLNTILLLSSGFSITWAHSSIILGTREESLISLSITIILAIIFTLVQLFEYFTCPFNLSDGVYGSTFFLATGFHGFHVLIGTIFLIVCLCRLFYNHFFVQQHFGFEAAAWYWHFVDVVWLFLFLTIYWWGY